jgi:hypothetical protein
MPYDTIYLRTDGKMMKWKRRKKPDEQMTLSVIEKANNAVRNAYCYSQWISIHQGNDSY